MNTKSGRIIAGALLLVITGQHAFTQDYMAAAAWGSLTVAVLLAEKKVPGEQRTIKTPRQVAMLAFIVLALALFGFQLYHGLTDAGMSLGHATTID
ncbi:hypothetical protein GU926_12760 [Nibribacter ruber]|uniref:Uncharacterized protein n=1 Tax=Nibribacter ruber TaxID=2698458 RepID=A0A6P1P084_9BACT|nr:hypothetical protein [Nibribacter ruber]QHL88254.1 hypothetical protein GU926_12760 [Nibribacter ruber]